MRRRLFASYLLNAAAAASVTGVLATSVQAAGNAGTWSPAANLITGREEHTATLLKNGTVLVVGGTDGRGKALATAELYSPRSNRWSSAGKMATPRLDHTATLLKNGKVLVVGGLDALFPSRALASAELYDPSINAWAPAAPMSAGRARHTATLLPDGRVLVVGGLSVTLREGGVFPNQATSAEIYDPATNHWTTTAPTAVYRRDQTATLLRDGRVLVTGGQDGLTAFSSAEIYDPAHDRWSTVASMLRGRFGPAASLLANGNVLVVGGSGREASGPYPGIITLSTAEVYDTRLNRWSAVASMADPHIEHTATLLSNGRVLVVGTTSTSQAELYDPERNVWSKTGPLMDRYQHTATRLPDGRVLIAGGYGISSLGSVLIYDPNGVAPAPRQPVNPYVITAFLITALLISVAIAFSIPTIRRRLTNWGKRGESDEWIA